MRTHLTRKHFLMIGLGAVAASATDCSSDDDTGSPAGGAGSTGNGGSGNGASGTSTGNSGTNTSSGGSAGTNSSGSSGNNSSAGNGGSGGSGNAGSGGSAGGGSGASGASGAGGGGGGNSCAAQISTMSSMTAGQMAHQHRMIIPLADIMAGVTKTFQTDVTAGAPGCSHCHQVELTAADLTMLKSGGVVKKQTCSGGDHEFVFSCAANPPAPVAPTAARCPTSSMEGACMPNPPMCP